MLIKVHVSKHMMVRLEQWENEDVKQPLLSPSKLACKIVNVMTIYWLRS